MDRIKGVSSRDFLKIAGTYGMSSTLLAAGAVGGAMTAANLAQAAESTYNRRYSKEPKLQMKFGAAGFNPQNLLIKRAGCLEFARDLEERTDGEIRIDSSETTRSADNCPVLKKRSRASLISTPHPPKIPPVAHTLSERAGLCLHVPLTGRSVLFHVPPQEPGNPE